MVIVVPARFIVVTLLLLLLLFAQAFPSGSSSLRVNDSWSCRGVVPSSGHWPPKVRWSLCADSRHSPLVLPSFRLFCRWRCLAISSSHWPWSCRSLTSVVTLVPCSGFPFSSFDVRSPFFSFDVHFPQVIDLWCSLMSVFFWCSFLSSGFLVSGDLHSFLWVIDPEAVVILVRSLTSIAQLWSEAVLFRSLTSVARSSLTKLHSYVGIVLGFSLSLDILSSQVSLVSWCLSRHSPLDSSTIFSSVAQMSVRKHPFLLASHFSWPQSSWRGFLLLIASESVPDIRSGRMWGPLPPIDLWLLRSAISVDTFFVTALGPFVLTDLRRRASCFRSTWTRRCSRSSPWARWHYSSHFTFSFSLLLPSFFHTSFIHFSFLSVFRAYIFYFLYTIYNWAFSSLFTSNVCHNFIQLGCKVAAANLG